MITKPLYYCSLDCPLDFPRLRSGQAARGMARDRRGSDYGCSRDGGVDKFAGYAPGAQPRAGFVVLRCPSTRFRRLAGRNARFVRSTEVERRALRALASAAGASSTKKRFAEYP